MFYLNILLSLIICILLVLYLSLLFWQLDIKPHKTVVWVWRKLVKCQSHCYSIKTVLVHQLISLRWGHLMRNKPGDYEIKWVESPSVAYERELGGGGMVCGGGEHASRNLSPQRRMYCLWHYHWYMVITKSKPTFSLFYYL